MKGRSASITVSSLYVILDVYPRYAVGWLVAPHESDRLAQELIAACAEQIPAGPAPRRLGRHPLPLPAPRVQRQPVLRSPVQDPQTHTTVPRTLRQPRPRTVLRRHVLRPLQPPPPPLRHGLPHPRQ